MFHDSMPCFFKAHAIQCLETVKNKTGDSNLIFLKSWNEWGEGNHMEPDLKYGKGYINALKEAVDHVFD